MEAHAGVVDQHVDGPQLARDPLEHGLQARRVGDVGADGDGAGLCGRGLRGFGVARGDGNARAGLPERARQRQPNPAVAAGDDGDLAVQVEGVEDAHGWTITLTLSGSSSPARSARSVSSRL